VRASYEIIVPYLKHITSENAMPKRTFKTKIIRYLLILLILWIIGTFTIYTAEWEDGHKGEYSYLLEMMNSERGRQLEKYQDRLIKWVEHAESEMTEEDKKTVKPFLIRPYDSLDVFVDNLKSEFEENPAIPLITLDEEEVIKIMEKYPLRWTPLEAFLSTNLYFVTHGALYVPNSIVGRIVSGIIILLNSIIFIIIFYKLIFVVIKYINKIFSYLSEKFSFISSFNRFVGHQITQFQLDKLGKLFAFLFVLWLIGGAFLWLFERQEAYHYPKDLQISNFTEALWSINVYLLSGYEEYIPRTGTGRVISVAIILIGVSVISIFTANIVTIITKRVQERDNFPAKPSFVDYHDHIVICGISDKTDRIIRQLHSDIMQKIDRIRQIVILAETVDMLKKTDEICYEQVWIIKGSPLNSDDLKKANISQAHSVIVLSDVDSVKENIFNEINIASDGQIKGVSDLDKILDARTILCVLAIESIAQKEEKDRDKTVHMCIELRDIQNKIHFSKVHNKEIICSKEFSQKLLVQSTVTFGTSHIYTDELLNASEKNTALHRLPIPKNENSPSVIPVGFITSGFDENQEEKEFICTNPRNPLSKDYEKYCVRIDNGNELVVLDKNYTLKEDDSLLVISYIKPKLSDMEYHIDTIKSEIPEKFIGRTISELEGALYKKGFTLTNVIPRSRSDEVWNHVWESGDKIEAMGDQQEIDWSEIAIMEKTEFSTDEMSRNVNYDDALQRLFECQSEAVTFAGIRREKYDKNRRTLTLSDKFIFYLKADAQLPQNKEKISEKLRELKATYANITHGKTCDPNICGLGVKDHIVICNWNQQAPNIIKELTRIQPERPIILILPDSEILPHRIRKQYKNVIVVLGQSSDYKTLIRAEVETASAIIILSEDTEDELADTISILTALMIENINPAIHTCVELKKSKNKRHFGKTKVDEIVCIDELTEKLLAQASINPGLSQFYLDLLTSEPTSNEIYKIDVPPAFVGKPYGHLKKRLFNFHEENIILMGIERGEEDNENQMRNKIKILPKKKEEKSKDKKQPVEHYHLPFTEKDTLNIGDKLFVISYHRPPGKISEIG
jgi:Trk K+ transport system NAD-binding subunit